MYVYHILKSMKKSSDNMSIIFWNSAFFSEGSLHILTSNIEESICTNLSNTYSWHPESSPVPDDMARDQQTSHPWPWSCTLGDPSKVGQGRASHWPCSHCPRDRNRRWYSGLWTCDHTGPGLWWSLGPLHRRREIRVLCIPPQLKLKK